MTSLTSWPTLADVTESVLPFSLAPRPASTMQRRLEDVQFHEMTRAFSQTGGVVSCNELIRLLRRRTAEPLKVLARWIGTRQALSFDWQTCTMLPLFQFDLPEPALRSTVTRVVAELSDTLDCWDLSLWFAQANDWLDGHSPVSVIDREPCWVLEAARADRYVARG